MTTTTATTATPAMPGPTRSPGQPPAALAELEAVVYSRSDSGHRAAYLRFVATFMRCRRGTLGEALRARQPVLFLTIEDGFTAYLAVALLRALRGRRTVGLLFRPRPAVESGRARHRLKRAALALLRRLDAVRTLTILPFSIDARFARIADGWIYDFQLWDLTAAQRDLMTAAPGARADRPGPAAEIAARAGARAVVCAVGTQTKDKGFDSFVAACGAAAPLRDRLLFAFGGRVDRALAPLVTGFVRDGGVAVDRRLDDDELLQLYGVADLIWACYAPGYDQASGVLGRAAQAGVPVVVRADSVLHALCAQEEIAHVPLDPRAPERLLADRPGRDPARGAGMATRFRAHSLAVLRDALA
jgi:hypothetical protein